MKDQRPIRNALKHALPILGYTVGGIVVAALIGPIIVAALFGDSDEAYWGFTVLFVLGATIALLVATVVAISRFFGALSRRREDEDNWIRKHGHPAGRPGSGDPLSED